MHRRAGHLREVGHVLPPALLVVLHHGAHEAYLGDVGRDDADAAAAVTHRREGEPERRHRSEDVEPGVVGVAGGGTVRSAQVDERHGAARAWRVGGYAVARADDARVVPEEAVVEGYAREGRYRRVHATLLVEHYEPGVVVGGLRAVGDAEVGEHVPREGIPRTGAGRYGGELPEIAHEDELAPRVHGRADDLRHIGHADLVEQDQVVLPALEQPVRVHLGGGGRHEARPLYGADLVLVHDLADLVDALLDIDELAGAAHAVLLELGVARHQLVELLLEVGVAAERVPVRDEALVRVEGLVPDVPEAHDLRVVDELSEAARPHELCYLEDDAVDRHVAVRDREDRPTRHDVADGDFSHGVGLARAGRSPDDGDGILPHVRLRRVLPRLDL